MCAQPAPGISRPAVPPTALRPAWPARRLAAVLKLCGDAVSAAATWSHRTGDTLQLWRERYRQRRALGGLNDHMLKDLGLSRSDTGRETGKRFWEG
jgi:uncharacterized protein YjiS (DUF1127 family)